jgi:hypothetical protein
MGIKTVEIGGVRYRWRDILRMRREQAKAERKHQPPLFELRDDSRPATQKTASSRFEEPSLFNT